MRPDDGYTWINPNANGDMRVQWEPGRRSNQYSNIIASNTVGEWLPADGYTWVVNPPVPGDFRVQWVPGRNSIDHPHVKAYTTPGQWLPDAGYTWVVDPPQPG